MKSCVFFAISVDDENKLYVVREYLDTLQKYFSDCKIFIGVNYGSHKKIEDVIKTYNLNYELKRLENKQFHISSDTSAFQLCMQMFKQEQDIYDLVWFIHTKGGFNSRDAERNVYINNFFPKRNFIENRFKEFPKIGVYGYRCGGYMWFNHENNICKGNTEKFIRDVWDTPSTDLFPNTFCEMIIIETMFAMNAEVVYTFLKTYPEFLTTSLTGIPTSRWYIELELCNIIPTRMGYIPMVISHEHLGWDSNLETEIKKWLTTWIEQNKLYHLNDYVRLL